MIVSSSAMDVQYAGLLPSYAPVREAYLLSPLSRTRSKRIFNYSAYYYLAGKSLLLPLRDWVALSRLIYSSFAGRRAHSPPVPGDRPPVSL